jgi:hypothetical protein
MRQKFHTPFQPAKASNPFSAFQAAWFFVTGPEQK